MASKKNKTKNKKTKKQQKTLKIISIICISCAAIFMLYMFSVNSRSITLRDLKTHYDSLSLNVSYSNNCADEENWKINYKTGDSYGEIRNATSDEYNCKRYFLGSRKQSYQKYFAAEWQKHSYYKEYPDSRITKVLEYISKSDGELLSKEDNGIFVFGIKTLYKPQEIYEYLNDISALGNDWGSDNYSSLSAKVYIHRNGDIAKIVFYPKSKSTKTSWYSYATNARLMYLSTPLISYNKNANPADYDYIRSCTEITWTFSNLNNTNVDYKEDLWNVLE